MFQQLLESGAPAPRRGGWAFASGMVHAAMIATAVALTLRDPVIKRAVEIIDIVYVPPLEPRPVAPSHLPPSFSAPATLTIVPLQPIDFPTVIPVGIPEPSTRLSDLATDIAGNGIITGPAGPARPAADGIHTKSTVDRAVIPSRNNAQPDYPGAMRAAGVDGSVLVQFVVDTTGRVEAASVSILRATHEQFGEAVRRWLGRTRYSPAEVAGRRVRQLVQQEVGFTLRP